LNQIGFRVILAEYPGYGGRPGQMNENNIVQDAKVTLRLAYQQYGKPVYVLGESLGCGVAAAVAADTPVPIAGLVLVTPWDSLPKMAQSIYWFLPARWLCKDKYDNIKNLASFSRRIAIAIAENDEIVPKKRSFGLFAALSNEKRLWMIRNAGHNTWPEYVSLTWWQEVMGYLENGDQF
jgi:pimeloyl-ACP methyl ester carboxylesterase